jgi:hypothetical protein
MRVLSIHRVFVILLLLHLVLPGALFCHDFVSGNLDLHIVDDELIGEERILFLLTREVLHRNQHVLDLLEYSVLFINSFVNDHLI